VLKNNVRRNSLANRDGVSLRLPDDEVAQWKDEWKKKLEALKRVPNKDQPTKPDE
jgi:hypothetical protein